MHKVQEAAIKIKPKTVVEVPKTPLPAVVEVQEQEVTWHILQSSEFVLFSFLKQHYSRKHQLS